MKLNNNDDSHNSGLNLLIYNMLLDIESHPTWVCGLKQSVNTAPKLQKVTPYVGVWIETGGCHTRTPIDLSHPTWVCGLKRCYRDGHFGIKLSHPTWVCGLKHRFPSFQGYHLRHTLRGCVD